MKKLYKTIPALLLTILLPINAAASGRTHATIEAVAFLSAVALFVFWLLYRTVKKQSSEAPDKSPEKKSQNKKGNSDIPDSATYSNMEITVKVNGKTTVVKNIDEIGGVVRSQITIVKNDN